MNLELTHVQPDLEKAEELEIKLPISVGSFPVVIYGYKSWTVKKLSAKQLMLLNCGVGEDS